MKALFIGIGSTSVCWYRCALPARELGHDWVGVDEEFRMVTGQVGGKSKTPVIEDYDVIICQQPAGPGWEKRLRQMKATGARLIYETDDYLHGIPREPDHLFKTYFTRQVLRSYDRCMAMCDDVIVSTQFLAERYHKTNPRIHVCRNGIDLARYDLERPERDYTTVGWSGATGHTSQIHKWLDGGVADELLRDPTSRFVAMGEPHVAAHAGLTLGEDRVTGIPWSPLETYPAAMTAMDVALAPAGDSTWYRGKSDLRWLEASALGIPCICQPHVYPEAELHASTPAEAAALLRELMSDPGELAAAGSLARERVLASRSMAAAAESWRAVIQSESQTGQAAKSRVS